VVVAVAGAVLVGPAVGVAARVDVGVRIGRAVRVAAGRTVGLAVGGVVKPGSATPPDATAPPGA
jgi:hypothetical protein